MGKINRVFLIVLDSVGIGGASDAKLFGDDNPNTLKTIAASKNFHTPNLARLGLFNIDGMEKQLGMRNAQCAIKTETITHYALRIALRARSPDCVRLLKAKTRRLVIGKSPG